MLARTPWTPPVKAKPKPKKLTKDRRRIMIDRTCRILRQGEPTRFSYEAACRHGIRRGLILQGWKWAEADAVAAEIVGTALRMIGAVRPTWLQGQPEYVQDGFAPIERTRCVRCKGQLPEGHFKFCCELCAKAHQGAVRRLRQFDEDRALDMAIRTVA